MKKFCFCLLAALILCACTSEPTVRTSSVLEDSSQTVSEQTEVSCMHRYGDEPVEIVGNLYVYECADCGAREVVPQGTLIGGEE